MNERDPFTAAEKEALQKAAFAALAQESVGAEIGEKALRSAQRKLARMTLAAACRHCKERPSRRRNRLCDRCNTYKRAYGRLPSEATLIKSGRRSLEKRTRPVSPRPPRD